MQVFMVTGLFAGQHNTKLHGTITGVIFDQYWERYLHRSLLANTTSANLFPIVSILLVA